MARQAGLFTPLGAVYVNETLNGDADVAGTYVNETSGGGVIATYGTANGQGGASGGVSVLAAYGTANGQGGASGAVASSGVLSAAGTANGHAAAEGFWKAIVATYGTANGQGGASSGGTQYTASAADGFRVSEATPWFVTLSRTLAQAMTVAPTQTPVFIWGRTIADILHLHDADSAGMIYSVTEAQAIHIAKALNVSWPLILTQAVTTHGAQAVAIGVQVLQALKLIPAATPATEYHLGIAQAIAVNDALGLFFGAVLTQAMTVAPTQARTYVASAALSQNLTVAPALLNTLSLCFHDTLDVTDEQLLQMIYQGDELLDGIALTGLYVSHSGTVTTWAINTRTNAVTTYDHFDFNGFAQMGNRYIGTSSRGVYELDGETDNGRHIIADIISGYFQLNATKMAGLKGAYLAVRGQGDFFLKLITGDGREYLYKLSTQPGLMNTKVNIGKGLRARYLSFQLTSTGQDFDLDSLEFVPMLSDRRV